jgi:hypothetical protein
MVQQQPQQGMMVQQQGGMMMQQPQQTMMVQQGGMVVQQQGMLVQQQPLQTTIIQQPGVVVQPTPTTTTVQKTTIIDPQSTRVQPKKVAGSRTVVVKSSPSTPTNTVTTGQNKKSKK